MTLPAYHYRTAWLRAFGTFLALGLMAAVGIVARIVDAPWWMAWSIGAGILFWAMIWTRPRLLSWPYRIWRRVERVFTKVGTAYLGFLFYFLVVTPVGLLARRSSARPATSWSRRPGSPPARSLPRSGVPALRMYIAGASELGRTRRWAAALKPLLTALRVLSEPEKQTRPPDDTYTLY